MTDDWVCKFEGNKNNVMFSSKLLFGGSERDIFDFLVIFVINQVLFEVSRPITSDLRIRLAICHLQSLKSTHGMFE